MNVLDYVKTELFRKPRKSRIDWMPVVGGSFMIVLSTAGILVGVRQGSPFRSEPEFGVLGLAFVCMGGAELLSVERRRSTALLRAISIEAFAIFLIVFTLTF